MADVKAKAKSEKGSQTGPFGPVRAQAVGPRRGVGTDELHDLLYRLCTSKPPIAAQSLAGSGLRPALRACNVSRQGAWVSISSPLRGRLRRSRCARLRYPSPGGLRQPPVTPRCSSPKPCPRPFGAAPCAAICEAAPKCRTKRQRRYNYADIINHTTQQRGAFPRTPRGSPKCSGTADCGNHSG